MTDLGLKRFYQALKRLGSLQEIWLFFQGYENKIFAVKIINSCPKISDEGLSELSKVMSKLNSVRNIYFGFYG